jgi:hypothetical protein
LGLIGRPKTELPCSNPCNNAEPRIQIKNKEKQTFDVEKVDITPSTLGKNLCTSAAIETGTENRLNNKHVSNHQEFLQWPNTPNRKLRGIRRGCHL